MPERSATISTAANLFDEMPKTSGKGASGRGLPGEAPESGGGKSASAAIVALAHAGRHAEVVELFCMMQRDGVPVSRFVLPSVLRACAGLQDSRMLRAVHVLVIKCALCQHVVVGTALVDGYIDVGLVDVARKAFDEISEANMVSWSVIIGGYVRFSRWDEAWDAFFAMQCAGVLPNDSVLVMAIQACSALGCLVRGIQLHTLVVVLGFERKATGWDCLIDMYGKCGDNLAERFVGLSVHALLIKHGKIAVRYFEHREVEDASDAKIACQSSNILLRKPKELVSKYKDNDSASAASEQTIKYSTNYKIREHELQILLRMEIIKSELGPRIEEGSKQKMIKEFCSLLQFIDINLQGDSFKS